MGYCYTGGTVHYFGSFSYFTCVLGDFLFVSWIFLAGLSWLNVETWHLYKINNDGIIVTLADINIDILHAE